MVICATCGVERDEPPRGSARSAPTSGSMCPRTDKVAHLGRAGAGGPADIVQGERAGTFGIRLGAKVGIGQTAQLVVTPEGSLLWDPVGYVDDSAMRTVLERGPVLAIAASHPHMFGVQVMVASAR